MVQQVLPVTAQAYPITVGAGGSGGPANYPSTATHKGSNSVFSTITSAGGGGGGGSGGGVTRPSGVQVMVVVEENQLAK